VNSIHFFDQDTNEIENKEFLHFLMSQIKLVNNQEFYNSFVTKNKDLQKVKQIQFETFDPNTEMVGVNFIDVCFSED